MGSQADSKFDALIESLVQSLGGQIIRPGFNPAGRYMIAFDCPDAASMFNHAMGNAMQEWQMT